jgi:hypothetical protein
MRFATAVLLLAAGFGVARAATPVIGWVVDINGPPSAYAINGVPGVGAAHALENGDRVSILKAADKGRQLTITLYVAGKSVVVDAAHSPYCVGSAEGRCGSRAAADGGGIPAVVRSILNSVSSVLRTAQDHYYSAETESNISMGARKPALAILENVEQLTPVTNGALSVPWLNGTAPFKATLENAQGAQIATAVQVKTDPVTGASEARFVNLHVNPGSYRVQVADATGAATAPLTFRVISSTSLPKLTPQVLQALDDPQIPAHVRAVWRASLLKSQGNQWRLAAYQELAPLPDDTEQVPQLRYLLTEG